MTLAPFDYESWRKPREDWQHLGLHWHCHVWSGDAKAFANDSMRRDRTSSVPPILIREWLHKPDRPYAATTPEDAVERLRAMFDRYVPQMMGTQATDIDPERRFGMALHDLQCGNDISWGFWLAGGASIVSMAVVGIADCPLH